MQWKRFRLIHSIDKAMVTIQHLREQVDLEKNKLLEGQSLYPSPMLERLLKLVEKRQQNLCDRMEYVIQCQMQSFTNGTPMGHDA